ncbi:hypothetical protein WA026_005645 [Henosepilachna vigintioctopunctata]|uniref:Phosphoserine phosphatase n=1 Tax=Henosepilachna vigintioctopunctata TaxID=420089 RepID=A0AAW1U4K4_9CUCU
MDQVKAVLKKADAVCFDVDSTVIQEEGIDELAAFCGKGREIAELTSRAMGGSMTFQESLSLRLNILKPSVSQIKDFLREKPRHYLLNIYSNKMKFFFEGDYAGFDETQPTSRSGGKAEVIRLLKEKYGYQNLVMIGDGATDLEACPPADAFIGYGGNVVRQTVQEKSKWFIKNFDEVIEVLNE